MQAIILAAGMGKRLKKLTKNNTKCMVEVNGQKLIDRMLGQLDKKGLSKIVIVIGYQGEALKKHVESLSIQTPTVFVSNMEYAKTNNIYSLYLAREYLKQEDTILLESDLIFEESVLDKLLRDPRDTLALVAKYEEWMDGTCLVLNDEDDIIQFIPGKNMDYDKQDQYYKTVNIYKFSQEFSKMLYVPFLEAYSKALGNNEYYEQVIKVIIMLDDPGIKACRLSDEQWYEIDDAQDLEIASSIFADAGLKMELIQKRYGGYWRYPKMLDFCYLVNPYYPPMKLLEEMKASLYPLITQYPSGMEVNASLAGKMFDVPVENIVVGNGAAELIKLLMEQMTGILGVICPTFEEYRHRYDKEQIVIYCPENNDFSYTVRDIMCFFENKDLDQLLLINPDNPSGNYISKTELLDLSAWARAKNIQLIVDESFEDFAEEEDHSLLCRQILEENPHLVVVKSISKSYGIPGLRLGILASGDTDRIEMLKRKAAIWNINSLGEFFLQIEEKYKEDYRTALILLKNERRRFVQELSKIHGIRVIPSQANYVMVELIHKTAKELTEHLLSGYHIFIKDLSSKVNGEYVRIAIRKREENDRLLHALQCIAMHEIIG